MRDRRRLARLEASLSPTQATLLWLAEAQRYSSLAAYAASLREQPTSGLPLVAVPQQARRAVRATLRGQPRIVVAEREQEALHEAVFLVQLVIELERSAQATLQRAELRWLVLLSDWQPHSPAGHVPAEASKSRRTAVDDLFVTLAIAHEACSGLERRYLNGRSALFPETLAAWQELREAVQLLAAGRHPMRRSTAVKARAGDQASALAETTRRACLALLGDVRVGDPAGTLAPAR